jgi:hypothetical protein
MVPPVTVAAVRASVAANVTAEAANAKANAASSGHGASPFVGAPPSSFVGAPPGLGVALASGVANDLDAIAKLSVNDPDDRQTRDGVGFANNQYTTSDGVGFATNQYATSDGVGFATNQYDATSDGVGFAADQYASSDAPLADYDTNASFATNEPLFASNAPIRGLSLALASVGSTDAPCIISRLCGCVDSRFNHVPLLLLAYRVVLLNCVLSTM